MRLGTLFGVTFRINPFFLVLLLVVSLAGKLPEALLVFGAVLLHELGHVLAARGVGLAAREVELLPFGGVVRMVEPVELNPPAEALVAAAGPLTSGVLALLAFLVGERVAPDSPWYDLFVQANLAIGGCNLLPALPLDGGRIWRAHLARRVGFRQATRRAARLGKICAVLLGLAGAAGLYLGWTNASALVLAFFVYDAADREARGAMYLLMRYLTRKKEEMRREGCLVAQPLVALESVRVRDVIGHFAARRYHLLVVTDERGGVRGIATEWELLDRWLANGRDVTVGEVIRRLH